MAMNYFGRISPIIHVELVAAINISQMHTVMDARGTTPTQLLIISNNFFKYPVNYSGLFRWLVLGQ